MIKVKMRIRGVSESIANITAVERAELRAKMEALYKAAKLLEDPLKAAISGRSVRQNRTGLLKANIRRKKKMYKMGRTAWVGVGARSIMKIRVSGKGRAYRKNPAKYLHLWEGGRQGGVREPSKWQNLRRAGRKKLGIGDGQNPTKALWLPDGRFLRRVNIGPARGARKMAGILSSRESAVVSEFGKLLDAEIVKQVRRLSKKAAS